MPDRRALIAQVDKGHQTLVLTTFAHRIAQMLEDQLEEVMKDEGIHEVVEDASVELGLIGPFIGSATEEDAEAALDRLDNLEQTLHTLALLKLSEQVHAKARVQLIRRVTL